MADSTANTLVQYLQRLVGIMRADPRTDTELLTRFTASQDEAAFAVLVGRYAALVWENCRRVLGSGPDAEDAFQATYLALARQAPSVRGDSLARWLYRVSRRVALNCRTEMRRRLRRESRAARVPRAPGADAPADDTRVIWEELENLPERLRVPLVLYYLDGKTQAEAGTVLGVSDRAVARRLGQALEALRERLTRRGFVVTAAVVGAAIGRASAAPVIPEDLLRRVAIAVAQGKVSPAVAALAARAAAPRSAAWVASAVVALGAACGAALVLIAGKQDPAPPAPARVGLVADVRPARAPQPARPAPWAVLAGNVTNEAGRPVPEARLAVLGRTWDQKGSGLRDVVLAEHTADADGRFRLTVEEPVPGEAAEVWLAASAPGLRTVVRVPVAAGVVPGDIAVRLVPGRVTGRVFGPDGGAVEGATVRVIRFGGAAFEPVRADHLSLLASVWPEPVTTGPDGSFDFHGLDPSADLQLAIVSPRNGAAAFLDLPAKKAGRRDLEARLPRVRRFTGRVLAADTRSPLSDAQVIVDFQPVAGAAPWVRSVRTDAAGRFALAVPVAPRWSVEVSGVPFPYQSARRSVELSGGDGDVALDVVVDRGKVARGRVTDDAGRPVRLAKVRFFPGAPVPANTGVPAVTPATTTDANGRFALVVDRDGGVLVVTAPSLDYAAASVDPVATLGKPYAAHAVATIAAGGTADEMAFRLERGRTIHGRAVLPNGAPVSGGFVWCHDLIGGRDLQAPRALTIQGGRFAVPGCRPGRTYTVVLADHTFRHGAVAKLVWADEAAEVALKPTGAVTVEVRNGADRVVPGGVATIELGLPADEGPDEAPPATRWFPLASGGPVGPDGQRHLPGLVPGARYRIGVSAGRGGAVETIVTVPSGAHRQTTLVLPEPAHQ
jgi:RNA polymerase sigma factor (sigma-70 family)